MARPSPALPLRFAQGPCLPFPSSPGEGRSIELALHINRVPLAPRSEAGRGGWGEGRSPCLELRSPYLGIRSRISESGAGSPSSFFLGISNRLRPTFFLSLPPDLHFKNPMAYYRSHLVRRFFGVSAGRSESMTLR